MSNCNSQLIVGMCIGTALRIQFDYDSPDNDSILRCIVMHCDYRCSKKNKNKKTKSKKGLYSLFG